MEAESMLNEALKPPEREGFQERITIPFSEIRRGSVILLFVNPEDARNHPPDKPYCRIVVNGIRKAGLRVAVEILDPSKEKFTARIPGVFLTDKEVPNDPILHGTIKVSTPDRPVRVYFESPRDPDDNQKLSAYRVGPHIKKILFKPA